MHVWVWWMLGLQTGGLDYGDGDGESTTGQQRDGSQRESLW